MVFIGFCSTKNVARKQIHVLFHEFCFIAIKFLVCFCSSGGDVGGLIADIFGDSDDEEEEFEVLSFYCFFKISNYFGD